MLCFFVLKKYKNECFKFTLCLFGMKKRFKTVFHETAQNFEKIYFSAGKVGCQVEIETTKAIDYIGAFYGDIIV